MSVAAGSSIGKYTVRRKLAEGGMAEIYLCSAQGPEGFEKEVVIKRVRPFLATDPSFVQMFIAEARLASRLNHPNLVQIFDFDRHDDTFYLAMEYVRGKSLWEVAHRCRERSMPMPTTLVARIGADIARGLYYAHRLSENGAPLGLVHRDVTPHNILLSYDGAVKLTDFGIAKAGNKLTAPGMLKGKFAYMAPEQARGEQTDARTDLFALGIVLWEILTGAPLFDGDSDLGVLRAVQQRDVEHPSKLNPAVSDELDKVVMKALERDPALRFQSAHELERSLARYVLSTARELEDTDLPGFLLKLFPEEASAGNEPEKQALPASSGNDPHQDTSLSLRKEATPIVVDAGTAVFVRPLVNAVSGPGEKSEGSRPSASQPSTPVAVPSSSPEGPDDPVALPPARRAPGLLTGKRLILPSLAVVALAGFALIYSASQKSGPPPAPPKLGSVAAMVQPREDPPAKVETFPKPSEDPPPKLTVVANPETAHDAGGTAVAPRRGALMVKVTPWAEVVLDGRKVGDVSGTRRFALSAGPHRVKFTHSQRKKEQSFTIEEGKELTLQFNAFAP